MLKIDWNPKARQLSQFGLIALFGFPLFGFILWYKFGAPIWVLWTLIAVGALTLGASRIEPKLVKPIYVGMTATEQLIAKQVSDVFPASVDDLPLGDAARRGLIAPLRLADGAARYRPDASSSSRITG